MMQAFEAGLSPVQRLTAEDLPGIAEIERASFSTPWSVESLRILTEEPNVGFFVSVDGVPVGYCGMQCVLDEGQITDIAVLPEYRRRGIAAALLDALVAYAKEKGLCVLYLEVRESNLPAISLYRDHFGFEVIGRRKGFYREPREDGLNMQRRLQ